MRFQGIPAEFLGVILDMKDDVEPLSELLDKTAKEEVRRVSETRNHGERGLCYSVGS